MKFKPPKGTKDLMPEDAEKMQALQRIVADVFDLYGFRPVSTPAFESFDLLSSKGGLGEAVKDEIYYFKDKSNRELGLRFDLTMPLARIMSSDPTIQKPFKRYSIGTVWRYDNPQAMRWREFYQADIDTIGPSSVMADAEIIAATCECLNRMGFADYYIRVNNRKFLDSKIGRCVPEEKIPEVFRVLDKLDKIGKDGVVAELKKIDCEKKEIIDLIDNTSAAESDEEIRELFDYLKDFGVDDKVKVDTSLVRGLDYYTSLVFEVFLGAKVSCGGGGRYNNLISKIGGSATPAVGISLGLDRILQVMKEGEMKISEKEKPRILIANVDDDVIPDVIRISQQLRKEGLACQINLTGRGLSKQLEFANSQGIRYVVVVGKKEIEMKRFQFRDMKLNQQRDLGIDSIVSKLRS